jgi:hypothetical protein
MGTHRIATACVMAFVAIPIGATHAQTTAEQRCVQTHQIRHTTRGPDGSYIDFQIRGARFTGIHCDKDALG